MAIAMAMANDGNDDNVDEMRGCLWQWQWQWQMMAMITMLMKGVGAYGNGNGNEKLMAMITKGVGAYGNGNDNNVEYRHGCLWPASLSPLAQCSQRLGGCTPYSPMSSSTKRFISHTLNQFTVYPC